MTKQDANLTTICKIPLRGFRCRSSIWTPHDIAFGKVASGSICALRRVPTHF